MDRDSSAPSATGSRTVTQTGTPAPGHERQDDRAGPSQPVVGVLKLRGDRPARRQKVGWTEGTIDNEGMGKKKSKICCIYHKPKAYDESSDESSSDESDCDHDHHHTQPLRHNASRGTPADQPTEVEESGNDSSESEGGAGDGRARPPKPRKGAQAHRDGNANHPQHGSKANKYDLPASGSAHQKQP